ncbi:MAG TPA: DUF3179 domain-containing protein, partial [Acidimicrobiales bacterium]|nr:DUF3179 domain-containing protein [Acidimicrobiales bacterium]
SLALLGPDTGPVVAGTDLGRSEVPLDDIVFDTFGAGELTLAEADDRRVEELRDAIVPLVDPGYVTAEQSTGLLADDDLVLGYVAADGSAWAHPHRILNFHEIVETELAGEPVVVTFCPLCRSGAVYSRTVDLGAGPEVLNFGNTSALYQNDLVMFDRQTLSYWWQVRGRAVVGALTGVELEVLASSTTTWGRWRAEHPDSRVLSFDTGYRVDYGRDPFAGYPEAVDAGRTPFPVAPEFLTDGRLPSGAPVVVVATAGGTWAVPVDTGVRAVVALPPEAEDTEALVVVDGPDSVVLEPPSSGDPGSGLRWEAGRLVDDRGSRWDLSGHAVSGPNRGSELNQVPSRNQLWFSAVAAFPGIVVVEPG